MAKKREKERACRVVYQIGATLDGPLYVVHDIYNGPRWWF